METRFRFTNERIRALSANPPEAKSTDLECSDTEVVGLKCLSGRTGQKRFLLRYRTLDGKKRSLTLGRFPTLDVNAARKLARKHLMAIAEGEDPKATREELKDQPTLSDFFWKVHLPLTQSRNRSWKNDAQRFRDLIEPKLGGIRYKDLTVAQVQHLQLTLKDGLGFNQAYSPATCNRALALLKTMGNHAVRLGIVEINQAAKIQLLREDNIRTRFLDLEESQRLITAARQHPKKAIGGLIIMLLLTGCRVSELRLAKHQDLDFKKRVLVIPPKHTKNKQGRLVYLTDFALQVIQSIPRLADNPHIFTGRVPGRPLTDIRHTFRQLLKEAGITDVENICLHTLRHSTASNMVSAGLPLSAVKAQLAHQSIQSSERYAKLTPRSLQETSDKVSQLFGG